MSKGFACDRLALPTRTFLAELKYEDDFTEELAGKVPITVTKVGNAELERVFAVQAASKYLSDTCNHIFLYDGEGAIAAHIHNDEFTESGEKAELL
jgi:hypothetical protein